MGQKFKHILTWHLEMEWLSGLKYNALYEMNEWYLNYVCILINYLNKKWRGEIHLSHPSIGVNLGRGFLCIQPTADREFSGNLIKKSSFSFFPYFHLMTLVVQKLHASHLIDSLGQRNFFWGWKSLCFY